LTGKKSRLARRAETLFQNLDAMIRRIGVEKAGFFTSTFPDNCDRREDSERRFNSYATHVLRDVFPEYIAIPERQARGAFHHHLATNCGVDIRSGFDFESLKAASEIKRAGYVGGRWSAGYFDRFKEMEFRYIKSANPNLRAIWRRIRETAPKYKFGRCELLPVISNAAACARYVGSYVNIQHNSRQREDKGLRTVRYSLADRPWSSSWNFTRGGHEFWRRGCAALAALLGVSDFSMFGPRWAYHLSDRIFTASEHFTECLEFAHTLQGMPFQARQMPVARFLSSLGSLTPPALPDLQETVLRESALSQAEHKLIHQNPALEAS
jgi:hypothetical protein